MLRILSAVANKGIALSLLFKWYIVNICSVLRTNEIVSQEKQCAGKGSRCCLCPTTSHFQFPFSVRLLSETQRITSTFMSFSEQLNLLML